MWSVKKSAPRDPFCDNRKNGERTCAETENFSLLYNIKAMTDGHSLIITKKHALGLLDLTFDEAVELFAFIKRVLPALLKEYGNTECSYDLKIRSGEFSGRTVDHFHLHLIPRRKVQGVDGKLEYERIYEKNLQNIDRPFLDIGNDVKKLRRMLEKEQPTTNSDNSDTEWSSGHEGIEQRLLNNVFYESKYFLALYSPEPVVEGHALLVPKRNIDDILMLTKEEIGDLINSYNVVMKALLRKHGNGSRSYITCMQAGGYDNMPTDRLHIHMIPRSDSDKYAGRDDVMYYDIYERQNESSRLEQNVVKELRRKNTV